MSTTEEEVRRRMIGEGESANYGSEMLASVEGLDPSEQVRRLKAGGFGVARPPTPEEMAAREQSRDYPANGAAGFTPPPRPQEVDLSQPVPQRALSEGETTLPGGLQVGDFDEATGKQIGEFGAPAVDRYGNRVPTASDIYGDVDILGTIGRFFSGGGGEPQPGRTRGAQKFAGAGAEPTGTRPVDTQGEAPVADAMGEVENEVTYPDVIDAQAALPGARRLSPDAVDVTDVAYSDFTDPAQIPGDIERAVLPMPPREGLPPDQGQTIDTAEPGQASAPEGDGRTGGIDRVRIHRMMGRNRGVTDAIVNDPDPTRGGLAGLEGPAGLSDEDLVKAVRMQAQGISPQDAANLTVLQKRAEAEVMRANAGMINARANALFPIRTREGMVYGQVDANGNLGFAQTDLLELMEPKVGNVVHDNGIVRTSNPTLLYPTYDQYGQPTGAVGAQDLTPYIGSDPNSERAKAVQNFIDMALGEGASAQEIIEQLDMRFGFADEE
jgi:hypothetical protein